MAYRISFFVFSFLFIELFKPKWLRFLGKTLRFAEILNFYIERIPLINQFKNKRILITGVCGTVGSELIGQLRSVQKHDDCEVIGIDNNEK